MKKIAHSLLLIGLSGWFLGGCVGTDMQDTKQGDEAFDDTGELDESSIQAEDAHLEEASSSEEYFMEEELGPEGEYSTEAPQCSGFSGSGSTCWVRCSNYNWYKVGCYYGCAPFVDWGQCTPKGDALCSRIGQGTGIHHCWN